MEESATAPVTVDRMRRLGGDSLSPRTTSPNASSIGSMSGEWNAWLTVRRRAAMPCASNAAHTRSTTSARPEITVLLGPLSAATSMPGRPAIAERTLATSEKIAAIAPSRGRACMSLPRATTSAAASSSDITSATTAAAISPIEWPTIRSGSTPHARHSAASACSIANSAGWVSAVSSRLTLVSSPNITARIERPR